MTSLSLQFAARVTDSISRRLRRARFKVIALYLGIIALVIILFSLLLFSQLRDTYQTTPQNITLTETQALERAQMIVPDLLVTETGYEIEKGKLFYVVEFEGDRDVKINMSSGEVSSHDNRESLPFFQRIIDELDALLFWVGLAVFIIAGMGSILVALVTLRPIATALYQQERFIASAAHELRNPLTALHIHMESQLRQNNDTIPRESYVKLLAETQHIITLSEELLDLEQASLTKGTKDLFCKAHECFDGVVHSLQSLVQEKGITMHVYIASDDIPLALSDARKVVYNLVHNAIKFNHQHGEVFLSWDGNTLEVRDTGVGIPTEYVSFVTEPFYMIDESRTQTDVYRGSGFGLALVQRIVDMYGGKLTITGNGEDGGTTVRVSLK